MFENKKKSFRWAQCLLFLLALSLTVHAAMQSDPGVRGGAPGAGGPIGGLTVKEGKFFDAGKDAFLERQSVQGTIAGTEAGLGPRFNLDSCGGCHAQPATGGTSPLGTATAPNPQVAVASVEQAANVAFFITEEGPVREARFKFVDPPANTIRDGGVHDLFTIAGRSDAPGCVLPQPNFATAAAQNNLIFRIPTPVFGAGLIQAISDATIMANKSANAPAKAALGISGHENREGNTGTITRFGWKAQNKSLVIFSGEAYNVEQGVTNELFPQERDEEHTPPACLFNATPEDHTNYELTQPQQISGDAVNFANFMLFLAPPTPSGSSASITNGGALFTSVGCALCHTKTLQTSSTAFTALSNQPVNLFSDLLVHHMGSGLADDIIQGLAGPDEFRTAPLWGLGQRKFFLHDGRTSDLMQAIQEHSSAGSEASGSITNFNGLNPTQKQDLLNFLRSL
jgi:CxxC motif-containing protein (DUF1111 family)